MAQQPISLQSPVGESEETNFGDFIEDKGAENPSDMTAIVLLKEKIKDVLETLTERERQVLEQRFGLVDGYSRTLEEVGRQFQVTRERIRQIEAKALRKWFGLRRVIPASAVAIALMATAIAIYHPVSQKTSEGEPDVVAKIDPQDYEVVADLDELIALDENSLWDEKPTL